MGQKIPLARRWERSPTRASRSSPYRNIRERAGPENAGVQTAKGEWIAFLDDDDEWLPLSSNYSSGLPRAPFTKRQRFPADHFKGPLAEYTLPKRFPDPREPISEYLFHRKGVFSGELGTPTLFARRDLLLEHPFRPRAATMSGHPAGLSGLHEKKGWDFSLSLPTEVICAFEQSFPGITNSTDWRSVLYLDRRCPPMYHRQGICRFRLLDVPGLAAGKATTRKYSKLLELAIRHGEPDPFHVLLFVGMRLIPHHVRRKLHHLFGRTR